MDLLRYLQDNHIPYWTSGKNVTPGWVNIRCPMPRCFDRSNHGGFNLLIQPPYYHCWKCGGHRLVNVVSVLSKASFRRANEIIKDYAGQSAFAPVERPKKSFRLPGVALADYHIRYLRARYFNPDDIIRKYHVLGTGLAGKYKLRIIIPIIYKGEIVSFQGRDITGQQELKYKACPQEMEIIPHKHTLYNLDAVENTMVITEGILDTWRIGDGAVATYGTSFTDEQVLLIVDWKKEVLERQQKPQVIVLYDGDAMDRAEKLATAISIHDIPTDLFMLPYGDPADLTPLDALELRKQLKL